MRLVGPSLCQDCGESSLVVVDLEGLHGNREVCDICGGREVVVVWWRADYWPEVDGLVGYDRERRRLALPNLTHSPWH
jgi:hypothetical protein